MACMPKPCKPSAAFSLYSADGRHVLPHLWWQMASQLLIGMRYQGIGPGNPPSLSSSYCAGKSEQQLLAWERELQEADQRLATKAADLREQLSRAPLCFAHSQAPISCLAAWKVCTLELPYVQPSLCSLYASF